MDSKICYGLRPVDSADFVEVDGYIVDKQVLGDYNKLKETFAVSMSSYADSNDIVEIKDNNGDKKNISQDSIFLLEDVVIEELRSL